MKQAWRWRDWPGRREHGFSARDPGIDLVAELNDGSLLAIQCKCYDESYTLQKGDIYSFLSRVDQSFDICWIVSTCRWGERAEEAIEDVKPTIKRINFHKYDGAMIREGKFRYEPREPWEIQSNAIKHVTTGLKDSDRGQLVMACGTGKTFTALRISERLVPDGGRILYLAPSIALVSQVRQEWLRYGKSLNGLVVCSDRSSGGKMESDDMRVSDLECKVTTDPKDIAQFLQNGSGTRVVFCTYQSLAKVSAAQAKYKAPSFDLAIADEAHRTTGVEDRKFSTIHDDSKLHSKKRLYMTATQRLFTTKSKKVAAAKQYIVKDMDDHDTYGRVLHRLSFKEAVEDEKLSDYRVIIMGSDTQTAGDLYGKYELMDTTDGKKHLKPEDVARLLGVAKAINGGTRGMYSDTPEQLSKVIGFSSSRVRSKAFTKLLSMPELHDVLEQDPDVLPGRRHEVRHLDGTSSSYDRTDELRRLGEADAHSPRMISNVKLFTEGIDVPSLDAVAFLDPRYSTVDVVQAVGRVMRRAAGKQFGYIIVPVLLGPGENLIDALERNSDGWKATGQVLRALASHDNRLPESPAQFLQVYDQGGLSEDPGTVEGIQTTLDLQEMSQKFYTHVANTAGLSKPGKAVSDDISYVVGVAASLFVKDGLEQELADTLGLEISDDGFTGRDTSKIAALLVINACMLHRRLLGIVDDLSELNAVCASDRPCDVLAGAWESIMKKDYKPVFEPALAIMRALSRNGSDNVNRAVYSIADSANRIADSLSELGYDHSGPLYHSILGTAKSDSANYTDSVSAVMLARLAFADFVDWGDQKTVNKLRIMDPACGTGTLLMAALQDIKRRMGFDSLDVPGQSDMHRRLVENVLCGMDINQHAIQLAACNLTLGAPTVDYKNMNLYTMQHGPQKDGTIKAGSIEVLRHTGSGTMGSFVNPRRDMADAGGEHVDEGITSFPMDCLDMVIMNPPFGSNLSRNRKFSAEETKRMQENERAIAEELERYDRKAGETIDMNSISTFFTPLADRLLDKKGGVLAKVLPVTACINASGLNERKFLADRFHIERIITSHDPKRINFSYKTSIHECLMVCRRFSGTPTPPTEFISLYRMPKTPEEAIRVADMIIGGTVNNLGSVVSWPAKRIKAGDWSPVQWSDAGLAKIIFGLESLDLLEPIGSRYEMGPDGRQVRGDAYRQCEKDTKGAVRTFWSISSDLRKTIRGEPESWRIPTNTAAKKLLERRSHILVAAKFRTTNGRLTALYSKEPSIGSGWIPVRIKDGHIAKALAVWWNSTPGRMMLLNRRSKSLDYLHWSLTHLREIRIPKPDNSGWSALYNAYEKVCDQQLLPLNRAIEDPVRAVIDNAAAKVLGMDPAVLTDWRRRLSREPSISNVHAGG